MKIVKFSMAAMLLTVGSSTCLNASESLADALSSGKISGELKFEYVKTNTNEIKRSDATGFAVGGELSYVTGSFKGLKAGVTFQTNHDMGLENNNPSKVDNRVSFTNTNLSQAYLDYSFDDKTSIKVGKQYIYTPLIFTLNMSHLSKDSYKAALLTTKAVPKTKIIAGIVTNYYQKDAGLDSNQEFDFDKPIYTFYLKNKSIEGLTFTTQALYSTGTGATKNMYPKILDQSFLYSMYDVKYKLPINFPLFVKGSYYDLDYDKLTIKDTSMYTLGFGTGFGAFKVEYDYTKTDEDNDLIGTIGDIPFLNSSLLTFSEPGKAGLESNVVKFDVDTSKFGINGFKRARVSYGQYKQEISGKKITENDELMLDFIYKFTGSLKNLTTRVRFATADYDYFRGNEIDTRRSEFRLLTVYKF